MLKLKSNSSLVGTATCLSAALACATGQSMSTSASARPPINILQALQAHPGSSTAEDLKKTFGEPDIIKNVEQTGQEAWLYLEGPHRATRLSFLFATGTLTTANWFVSDSDSDCNLASAKEHFPAAHFQTHSRPWTNPHYAPAEDIYSDDKTGVGIVYSTSQQKVRSIYWNIPAGQLARKDK